MIRRLRSSRLAAALGVILVLGLGGTFLAQAETSSPLVAGSFTPITLTTSVASTARREVKLPITIKLHAEPGVLNNHNGPFRLQVKLASECGGTFQTTPGTTLLNQRLSPAPTSGLAYSTTLHADSGRPAASGAQTVCEFLEDSGVGRVYASDQSITVDVQR